MDLDDVLEPADTLDLDTPADAPTVTDDVRERVRAERLSQGLPEHIEDPVTLAKVAALVRVARQRQERW